MVNREVQEHLDHVRAVSRKIIDEIKDQYLGDSTPWVVGFSGGKDSTALLQLIFYALGELPQSQRAKEIHVSKIMLRSDGVGTGNISYWKRPRILDEMKKKIERFVRKAKNRFAP